MAKSAKPNYYDEILEVPEDFEGACKALSTANSALYYWGEEIKMIDKYLYPQLYNDAQNYKRQWNEVKQQAQKVIATYQLKLF